MPLVTHPVRSLWGSQPRCARCVCEWLHRKWDSASLPYPGGKGGTSILISIEVISCFGAREYTSWNLNLLWSVGKLGSTDVNSDAALHGETILALWDLVCYFKCILNFWDLERELGNENIFWNAKYKRYYNVTWCVNSWGDLGDWSAGFPGFQVQYSHWFLCWRPCCLHLKYPRSGDYADWSPGFPMSKMKGNMCSFVLVWVFRMWGPICDSVYERYCWTDSPPGEGCTGVVSVTDFPPLPGGRRSQVGPSESVCTGSEILLKRQNHWQKLAR